MRIPDHLNRVAIDALKPFARNARTHSKAQIAQIARSIERFGFTNPVLVSDDLTILAGHGRVAAAKSLGMAEVPVVRLSHLSEDERRAYVLADNRLAEKAGWDQEILALELGALCDLDFDVTLTGFDIAEADAIIAAVEDASPASQGRDEADWRPPPPEQPVTRPGDLWVLGRHRLLCGDARFTASFDLLMNEERAAAMFADPPYNVPIDGHCTGLGRRTHREFAMASGEMDAAAFTTFLRETLNAAADRLTNGAIAFVCMDWRHMGELLTAGSEVFSELKNLCVWAKTNGGMGSFYRSQHELVFVFKNGEAPHLNTFGLGASGRYRTNLWTYAGVSSIGKSRDEALAMHPTVKPTALVEDALRDVTRRGDLVLDPFGGSGTTLIAAERCGRAARVLELDPAYCDVVCARFTKLTGKAARLAATGEDFETTAARRLAEGAA